MGAQNEVDFKKGEHLAVFSGVSTEQNDAHISLTVHSEILRTILPIKTLGFLYDVADHLGVDTEYDLPDWMDNLGRHIDSTIIMNIRHRMIKRFDEENMGWFCGGSM